MSAWVDYLAEKKQIDALVEKGYSIIRVLEHLNGMDVQFSSGAGIVQLQLMTADARKYLSRLVIAQLELQNKF